MNEYLTLDSIDIVDNSKVVYNYTYSNGVKKYFNSKEPFYVKFNSDISNVPESILTIPFLANFAPISWFANFKINTPYCDYNFYKALETIKVEFSKSHKSINLSQNIFVKKIEKNTYPSPSNAMLFSGGVDAYFTYYRNLDKPLDLVSILGADIDLEETDKLNTFIQLNENEKMLDSHKKHYIESNLRTFYSKEVELLLESPGWWGKVQHGLALNSIVAPLSYIFGYNNIYIASSYTDFIDIAWGSTPEIDNNINWGNTSVIHDGYESKRIDKVTHIVKGVKQNKKNINLRVCYSENNNTINCSKCEKCYRTIFGIILSNDNPNLYGFNVDESVYEGALKIFKKGTSSKGVKYFWWEIHERIKESPEFYVFNDKEREMELLQKLSTAIDGLEIGKYSSFQKIKFNIIKSFPKLFKTYLKIRKSI